MKTPEQVRLECGFDLTHLADLAGVSGPTVGRLERGETKCLRPLTLQKIGGVLANRLNSEGIQYTVAEFIAACIAVRDAKMRTKNLTQFRRTA